MYTSLTLISSVAALALASPIPAVPHRHRLQPPQNNLNPNLFAPIEDKIYAGSRGSRYRPDLSDSEYVDFRGVRKGAIRGAAPNAVADPNVPENDVPDQNQIMNEISNIIKENNMRVKNIKNPRAGAPETPVLSGNQAPVDLAEPIVNAQDPNNAEQFERLPLVNREIFKMPDRKQRIPIVNDDEGIVYNAPKVHERIPIKDHNKIDLEDTKNVDAIINKLDEHMKDNGDFQAKLHLAEEAVKNKMEAENNIAAENKVVAHHGELSHHDHHHHDLHRGADMVDKAVRAA